MQEQPEVTIVAQNDARLTVEVIGGIIALSVEGKTAVLSQRQGLDLIEAIHSEES